MDKNVLLIDDDESILNFYIEILKDEGYQVDAFLDGREAIESFKIKKHKLIVTDMKMPGFSGIDLLKKVKDIDSKVKVVILTAHGEVETYIKSMDFGAIEYINKGTSPDEIKTILNALWDDNRL